MDFIKISIRRLGKDKFLLCVYLIIILASFLRFYNFDNRWGLAYDQSRDVLVARAALDGYKLPLVGPFSSAGQFVYGPQWFWTLMFMINIYPSFLLTPWLIQSFLYVAAVFLMILIGKEINGKVFGLFVGFLAAISPAQIAQSTNLTSPSMVAIFSMVSVYFFIRYIKYQKTVDIFLMGLCVSTSINIHFQAIGLLILIPISLSLGGYNLNIIRACLAGAIIPFIPLIIFDLSNNFFESKNMIDYYRFGQYRIYIPNRWLTYVGVFWPHAWARIVGGNTILGYTSIILISIVTLYKVAKREVTKPILSIIISFFAMFVILRYYRGEKFDSYLTFFHPFILILTAWVIFQVYRLNRTLGFLVLIVFLIGSINMSWPEIINVSNNSAFRAESWKNLLISKYPGEKFAVYDYGYSSAGFSLPLVLFLYNDGRISDKGHKIGFGSKPKVIVQDHKEILGNKAGFRLRDLDSSTSAQLSEDGWAFINPSSIYRSTEEWYYKK